MFIGEYSHNIDQKGRMAIPVKFRGKLSEGAVVTRGLDNCLFLYTQEEWEKMALKLANLPTSQANARAFARLMLAGAMDVTIDKQGRIVIPSYLRDFAGIKGNVVVTGLYNKIEIWDESVWKEYKEKVEKESTDIAENIAELGI